MNLYIYLLFIKNCFILMKLNNLFNYFKNNSLSFNKDAKIDQKKLTKPKVSIS